MDRPTKRQVDDALFGEEEHRAELADWDIDAAQSFQVLAAEVRALRDELDRLQLRLFNEQTDAEYQSLELRGIAEGYELERDELRAAITRVEMLYAMAHEDRLVRVGDIRAALRGENHG